MAWGRHIVFSSMAAPPTSSTLEILHDDRLGPKTQPASPPAALTSSRPIIIDKTLASAANLSQLLPTGTVLAFQSLSPSFANRGLCFSSNRYLTAALIVVCAASCAFFSLTDSLTGRDGRLYYGVATRSGLRVLNFDAPEEERGKVLDAAQLRRYRLRAVDGVHALFSVLVFLTIAFSDGMIQNCMFPDAGANARELLVNLPLGAGVVSFIVFMLFPTSRKGIGYTNYSTKTQ